MDAHALRPFLRGDTGVVVDAGDALEGAAEAYVDELVRAGLAERREAPLVQAPERKVLASAPSTKRSPKAK